MNIHFIFWRKKIHFGILRFYVRSFEYFRLICHGFPLLLKKNTLSIALYPYLRTYITLTSDLLRQEEYLDLTNSHWMVHTSQNPQPSRDTYLYFQEMHLTWFKHKYPHIEFSCGNPKKQHASQIPQPSVLV